MKILYIGDIMGSPGISVVETVLPKLRLKNNYDLVVAQSENVTDGKGMSVNDMRTLQKCGIDFFTGGNHSVDRKELLPLLSDANAPVIGPANIPNCPGVGWKFIKSGANRALVISLLGQVVGKDSSKPTNNPLAVIDNILETNKNEDRAATIVNFHGDFSSEKRIIGYYLDGRVSVVIGDHWHVPTADAMVLPKGTAHISDVGMCGSLHSSLGVELGAVITRWRDGTINKNTLALDKPYQFNAVEVNIDPSTGLANSIIPIQRIIN